MPLFNKLNLIWKIYSVNTMLQTSQKYEAFINMLEYQETPRFSSSE